MFLSAAGHLQPRGRFLWRRWLMDQQTEHRCAGKCRLSPQRSIPPLTACPPGHWPPSQGRSCADLGTASAGQECGGHRGRPRLIVLAKKPGKQPFSARRSHRVLVCESFLTKVVDSSWAPAYNALHRRRRRGNAMTVAVGFTGHKWQRGPQRINGLCPPWLLGRNPSRVCSLTILDLKEGKRRRR